MLARLNARLRKEKAQADEMYMVCPRCHQWGRFGRCTACGFDAGDPTVMAQMRADQARTRAQRRAFGREAYEIIDGLFHFHSTDFVDFIRNAVKWCVLGSAVEVIEGSQRTSVVDVLHGHADHSSLILTQTAADIMTTPIITVTTDMRAFEAIRLLMENQIKRAPVIGRAGDVVGLVSRRALLNGMAGDPEPPPTI